jgi:hypothetical protein
MYRKNQQLRLRQILGLTRPDGRGGGVGDRGGGPVDRGGGAGDGGGGGGGNIADNVLRTQAKERELRKSANLAHATNMKHKRKLEDQKVGLPQKLKRIWEEEADRYDQQLEDSRKITITARVIKRYNREFTVTTSPASV